MSAKASKSSPVTVLRPDPETGELRPVAVVGVSGKPRAVPKAAAYVVWDNLCQTTRAGDTLEACALYLSAEGERPNYEYVVAVTSTGNHRALTAEEKQKLRCLLESATS